MRRPHPKTAAPSVPEHLPQWGRLGAWREAKRLYAEGERVSVGSARTGQIDVQAK